MTPIVPPMVPAADTVSKAHPPVQRRPRHDRPREIDLTSIGARQEREIA